MQIEILTPKPAPTYLTINEVLHLHCNQPGSPIVLLTKINYPDWQHYYRFLNVHSGSSAKGTFVPLEHDRAANIVRDRYDNLLWSFDITKPTYQISDYFAILSYHGSYTFTP